MTHTHATARTRRLSRTDANLRRQLDALPGLRDALESVAVEPTEAERRLVEAVLPRMLALVIGETSGTERLAHDLFPDAPTGDTRP